MRFTNFKLMRNYIQACLNPGCQLLSFYHIPLLSQRVFFGCALRHSLQQYWMLRDNSSPLKATKSTRLKDDSGVNHKCQVSKETTCKLCVLHFSLFCFCSWVGLGTKSNFLGSVSVCVGLSEARIILSVSASPFCSARVPVM